MASRDGQVSTAERIVREDEHVTGVRQIRVERIRLMDPVKNSFCVYWRQPIGVSLDVEVLEAIKDVAIGAAVRTLEGTHVLTVQHDDGAAHPLLSFEPGKYTIQFALQNDLRPGLYRLHVGADIAHIRVRNVFALDAVTLEVLDHDEQGGIASAYTPGLVNAQSTWRVTKR
ncbi:MAG: hypothetical protein FJ279_08840 [Planctomycetes bacterium]|nr:hypothetical protein [Planctomycetota bacterium]